MSCYAGAWLELDCSRCMLQMPENEHGYCGQFGWNPNYMSGTLPYIHNTWRTLHNIGIEAYAVSFKPVLQGSQLSPLPTSRMKNHSWNEVCSQETTACINQLQSPVRIPWTSSKKPSCTEDNVLEFFQMMDSGLWIMNNFLCASLSA